MSGWQCYRVSRDKIVGCIGQSELMTRRISRVKTFTENLIYVELLARSLLCGSHPLDENENVKYSIKWRE
jgi:hypothetical protein